MADNRNMANKILDLHTCINTQAFFSKQTFMFIQAEIIHASGTPLLKGALANI